MSDSPLPMAARVVVGERNAIWTRSLCQGVWAAPAIGFGVSGHLHCWTRMPFVSEARLSWRTTPLVVRDLRGPSIGTVHLLERPHATDVLALASAKVASAGTASKRAPRFRHEWLARRSRSAIAACRAGNMRMAGSITIVEPRLRPRTDGHRSQRRTRAPTLILFPDNDLLQQRGGLLISAG